MTTPEDPPLAREIRQCTLCAPRFAATATRHPPRPIAWFRPGARVMIVSQAPGNKVQQAGRPFWDASGNRLRDWLGLDRRAFYDQKGLMGPPARAGVTATVTAWRDHAPGLFPLPHPSWRNTAWLKRNPWFTAELLPALRARVQEVMEP